MLQAAVRYGPWSAARPGGWSARDWVLLEQSDAGVRIEPPVGRISWSARGAI